MQLHERFPSLQLQVQFSQSRHNTLHSSTFMMLDKPQLINIYIKASVMTQSVICSSVPLTPSEENKHQLAPFSHHLRECFGNTITSLVHPL